MLASAAGHVAAIDHLYGAVLVEHWNGWSTLYAHMTGILVELRQQVWTGQRLGLIGATHPGLSAMSPHLHYAQLWHARTAKVELLAVPYPGSQERPAGVIYGPTVAGQVAVSGQPPRS